MAYKFSTLCDDNLCLAHTMYSAILRIKARMKLTYNYVLIHICWHKPILETVLLLLVTKEIFLS